MSASRRPTRHPARARAIATLHATELLPTPPLPLITSTMLFTPGSGSSGATARACSSRGGALGRGSVMCVILLVPPGACAPSSPRSKSAPPRARARSRACPVGHRVHAEGGHVVHDEAAHVQPGERLGHARA